MNFYFLPQDFTDWNPFPSILIALVVMDIIGLWLGRLPKIDHVSHLGGYASGIVAGLAVKLRAHQRKEADEREEKRL